MSENKREKEEERRGRGREEKETHSRLLRGGMQPHKG